MDKAAEELLGLRDQQLTQLEDTLKRIHAFNHIALPELQSARHSFTESLQSVEPNLTHLCHSLHSIYTQIDQYEAEMDRAELVIEQAEKDLRAVQEYKSGWIYGRIKGIWGRIRG